MSDLRAAFERGTREFLEAWYGVQLPEETPEGGLPAALDQWLHWQTVTEVPLTSQNHFLDAPVEQDGQTVFYVENQGVTDWAYPSGSDSPDPPVLERQNDHRTSWEATALPLSEFIHQVAAFEAAMGAEHSFYIDEPRKEEVEALSLGFTEFEETFLVQSRLFIGADAMLFVLDETLAIYAGITSDVIEGARNFCA